MSSTPPPAVEPPVPADESAVPAAPPAASPAVPAAAAAADASPAAVAHELKQRFPALFSGAPKPLKLRIQADIQERAPGVFTKQALSAFFRRYTGSTSYLIALSRASHRFDLDGQPAGELSAEHRDAAVQELARRRANHEARRAQEEEERRNRARLLRDFEQTTLTPANFCALKGVAPAELDGLLAIARQEAEERARQMPPPARRDVPGRRDDDRRRSGPGRHDDERRRSGPPARAPVNARR